MGAAHGRDPRHPNDDEKQSVSLLSPGTVNRTVSERCQNVVPTANLNWKAFCGSNWLSRTFARWAL